MGGRIDIETAAAKGQTRYNHDFNRNHQQLVTGRNRKKKINDDDECPSIGLFHELRTELQDSLVVTGKRHAETTRNNFAKALCRQRAARAEKYSATDADAPENEKKAKRTLRNGDSISSRRRCFVVNPPNFSPSPSSLLGVDDSADDEDKILRSLLMTIVLCDDGENELTDRAKDPKRRKRRCTMMECVL